MLERGLPLLENDLDFHNVISTLNLYRSEGAKALITVNLEDEDEDEEDDRAPAAIYRVGIDPDPPYKEV
jgi:hypothetical protein